MEPAEAADSAPARLQHLPLDLLTRVAVLLPDPGPLAAACHATAALLDQDLLLLTWAEAWAPLSADSTALEAQHRHPGYAALHWRRLRHMSTPRLASLLLQWVARRLPQCGRMAQAQQQLAAGDAVAALYQLLPFSEHSLIPYAAQAGHVRLLADLLAAPGVVTAAPLRWRTRLSTDNDLHEVATMHFIARAALHAAARSGHVAAMQMLLEYLESIGDSSGPQGLLETAVRGGTKGAPCVLALLQLGQHHIATTTWASWGQLLDTAVAGGDAVAMAALLALDRASHKTRHELCTLAVRHGHVQLLPLLRPADITDVDMAVLVCQAMIFGQGSKHAGLLELLPGIILQVLSGQGVVEWCGISEAIGVLLDSTHSTRLLASLQAGAADLTDKQQYSLAYHVWHALASAKHEPPAVFVRWAVQECLPHLTHGITRISGEYMHQQAALNSMRLGHSVLLQAPEVTANLISSDAAWQHARMAGALLQAVRSGQAEAVQAAVQLLGDNVRRVVVDAVICAAEIPDPASAEAVTNVLAPALDDTAQHSILRRHDVLLANGGRLLRVLCEHCDTIRAAVAGAAPMHALGAYALAGGHLAAATWLVSRPHQAQDYVQTLFVECTKSFSTHNTSGLTALLHRLAALPGVADSAQHISDGSSVGDSSSDSEEQPPSRAQLPAGLRQLGKLFIAWLLGGGGPDAVHALLVYPDGWGLLCADEHTEH